MWADNLETEFAALRAAVDKYPFISMVSYGVGNPADCQDTEFPGIVARPIGTFKTGSDYHYQTMRCNVDMLKIIQLGITLCDEEGNSPEGMTWQFNFQFNLAWVQRVSAYATKADDLATTCTLRNRLSS